MSERVTDRTQKTTTPARTDIVHNVDVSDTTENAAGSSFKMDVDTLAGAGLSKIQGCIVLARTGSDQSMTALEAGDLIIYEDTVADEMIMATIILPVTTIPADLRVAANAARWIDTSALL